MAQRASLTPYIEQALEWRRSLDVVEGDHPSASDRRWLGPGAEGTGRRLDANALSGEGALMRDFLDLAGQSGATYRFRRWPEREPHQPIAGNYVLIREAQGGGIEVLALGATNDLSLLRKNLTNTHTGKDTHVFTRLNVARGAREAEHDDLAAAYPKAKPARGMGA